MYRISLKDEYKSLPSSLSFEFPNFVILTGLNGAGKSQLLSAMHQSHFTDIREGETELKSRVQAYLVPSDDETVHREATIGYESDVWRTYTDFTRHFRSTGGNFAEYKIMHGARIVKVFENIANSAGKSIESLDISDFREHFPINDGCTYESIFMQKFSTVFKRYFNKQINNDVNSYRSEKMGRKDVPFLTAEEFSIKYPNPREVINGLISAANLDYEFNQPDTSDIDIPFDLRLVSKINGKEVKISELSSGERILLSLAFSLYNAKLDYEFPQLILMDEPDASLHPSMAKQFLDVIKNEFVEKKGVRVVITTHSPTTVALAPEESLFVMNKTGRRIEKTTKDAALKILTAGVPSFSVNYENRRQVFVESQNDVFFYENIYEKLSNHLNPEISLSFISSGESRTDKNGQSVSNCGQVINITKTLRTFGNKFIFGIVDWDGVNREDEFVKVLGENKRYTIENYTFDPILISALLMREREITRENLELVNNESFSDFKRLSPAHIQHISNFFISVIARHFDTADNTIDKVKYVNGMEIEIPRWYLIHHGHDLETKLKSIFGSIKRFHKEGALKEEIITKIVDDIPEFISLDILELFRSIQNT